MSDARPPQMPYTSPAPPLPPFAEHAPFRAPQPHQAYPGAAPVFITPATHGISPGRGSALGVVALIAALGALVVPSIVGGLAAYQVGEVVGAQMPSGSADVDLGLLSPVRGTVLVAEIAFWAGTIIGIWALVQGIVAAVRGHGRGAAVAAIVVAVVAAIAFGAVALCTLTAGITLGAASAF